MMWSPEWHRLEDIPIIDNEWYLTASEYGEVVLRRGGGIGFDDVIYVAAITENDRELHFHEVDEIPPEGAFILVYSHHFDNYLYIDNYSFDDFGRGCDSFGQTPGEEITCWVAVDINDINIIDEKFNMNGYSNFIGDN